MKSSETKIRLLATEKLLRDNPQGMTLKQIVAYLDLQFNISVERKTVYDDVHCLTLLYDVQIIRKNGKTIYVMR